MGLKTQTPYYNSNVINARIDHKSYNSMLSLMSLAGYEDVSSFVRDSVLVKCKQIADDVSGQFDNRTGWRGMLQSKWI